MRLDFCLRLQGYVTLVTCFTREGFIDGGRHASKRGDHVYTLSLGEARFEIPMLPFDATDFKRGCRYSESRGLRELRTIISEYYWSRYGAKVNPENELLLSAGSKLNIGSDLMRDYHICLRLISSMFARLQER